MTDPHNELWQEEHRGVHINRRVIGGSTEFYCTVKAASGRKYHLVATSPGSLHAMIDVAIAGKPPTAPHKRRAP